MTGHAAKLSASIVGLVLSLAGCQTLATDDDIAARITNPTDASRSALQDALKDALGTDVTLAADALTDSSALSIERNPPRSIENLPAQGRNMDRPILFRLVISGAECVLIDQRDNSRYVLKNTSCVAE